MGIIILSIVAQGSEHCDTKALHYIKKDNRKCEGSQTLKAFRVTRNLTMHRARNADTFCT